MKKEFIRQKVLSYLKQFFVLRRIIVPAVSFGFLFGLLLITFYVPHYYHQKTEIVLQVDKGEEVSEIVENLYDLDVIDNEFMMKLAVFITRTGNQFKTGSYKIKNGQNYFELITLLTDGTHSKQKLITIPEGIWQNNLEVLLENDLGLDVKKMNKLNSDKAFLKSLGIKAKLLEGYLLPETFYFSIPNTERNVFRKLKLEQDKLFDENARIQMALLKMNRHQILTLASIIDGESNKTEEFKRIAGVYYNRLNSNMRLQADPTVQYLIRNRRRHNKIYYKDLEIKSPYNTYIYSGLPPGPINNPGKAAIEAALYPEQNDYYYFVASGNGGHYFAKTRVQHNKNVQKYRRWRLSRK